MEVSNDYKEYGEDKSCFGLLPDEITTYIFSPLIFTPLTVENLRNQRRLRLVCRRWNKIVGPLPKLSQKESRIICQIVDEWRKALSDELRSNCVLKTDYLYEHILWLENTQRLSAISFISNFKMFEGESVKSRTIFPPSWGYPADPKSWGYSTDSKIYKITKVCRKVFVYFPNPNFKESSLNSLSERNKREIKFLEENFCHIRSSDLTSFFDEGIRSCVLKVAKAIHEEKYLPKDLIGKTKNFLWDRRENWIKILENTKDYSSEYLCKDNMSK